MKNKRKVLAPTIAGLATCSMVLPLALSATSCSCSKFASTSVLDGDYIPDYEPYDAGTSTWIDPETGLDYEVPNFVNIPQGEDLMLKAYINDKKMPAKEHKWMASGAAYYLTYYASLLNNQLGYDAIKINKYNADLKNFKVEDPRTGRVSYDISQDIDVTLDVQPGNLPFPSNLKLDSIAGNIRLAWNHKVKNMPLGIFDLGTDNWNITGKQQELKPAPFGDKPFDDMTLWFVAPDMSEVPAGDKTWALDLDFLIDANVDINGDKLIDIDHEYNFTFDKYAAWGIEQIVQALSDSDQSYDKIMGIAYIVERFIPLCAGWMSYYLNQCHHMDHIMSQDVTLPKEYWNAIGWQTETGRKYIPHSADVVIQEAKKTNANDSIDTLEHWEGPNKAISEYNTTAWTKFGKPANIIYELPDGSYTDNDIMIACIGVNSSDGRFSFGSLFKELIGSIAGRNPFPFSIVNAIHTDYSVDPFGSLLNVKYDWSSDYLKRYYGGSRPKYGESTASMSGVDALLPIVMTKDWVAFGDPFTLSEDKSFWDEYPSHNPVEGEEVKTQILPMTGNKAGFDLRFTIDRDMYGKIVLCEKIEDLFEIRLENEDYGLSAAHLMTMSEVGGEGDNIAYAVEKTTQADGSDKYTLVLGVNVADWEEGAAPDSMSNPFQLYITYHNETERSDTLKTAPFQLMFGGGQDSVGVWNYVSKRVSLGSNDDFATSVVSKAIYSSKLYTFLIGGGEATCSLVDNSEKPLKIDWLDEAFRLKANRTDSEYVDLEIPFRDGVTKTTVTGNLLIEWDEEVSPTETEHYTIKVNGLTFAPDQETEYVMRMNEQTFIMEQNGAVDAEGRLASTLLQSQAVLPFSKRSVKGEYKVSLMDASGAPIGEKLAVGYAYNGMTSAAASAKPVGEDPIIEQGESDQLIDFQFYVAPDMWAKLERNNFPFTMRIEWADEEGTPHSETFGDLMFVHINNAKKR